MMGRSHLLLGAAGFLAIEKFAPTSIMGPRLNVPELAAGTLIACGAAMLPDIDHPQATLARCLPPVSSWLSHIVNKLAGGHRRGTHTIWAWALVGGLTYWALKLPAGPVIALGISIFASLLMLRVLTESDGLICLLLAFVLGGAAVLAAGTDYTWLLQAVIIGFGLHLVGDIVTTEGIPPFFPLPPNIAIPIIGKVGGPVEQGTGALCGLIAFYFLVATVFLPGWDAQIKARGAATAPAPAPAITQKAVANTPPSKPASTKTTVAATQPAVAVAASSAPVSSHSIIYKIKHLP